EAMAMITFSTNTQIGLGLTGFGLTFIFLGIVLLFDKGLLAIGNVLFITGVSFLIGLRKTFTFFLQKHKLKGSIAFFLGIFIVLSGHPVIGILIEACGFYWLFRSFIPTAFNYLTGMISYKNQSIFQFFDNVKIIEEEINDLLCHEGKATKITCSASSQNIILLGEDNGFVHIISKLFKVSSFKANQVTTTHIRSITKQPYFITCGSDQQGINPLIKIWNLDKLDRLNQPTCTRVIRANSGFLTPSNVTCLECNETMSFMVVGYDDGQVVTFRGDISRQRSSKVAKPVRVSLFPITGLALIRNDTPTSVASQRSQSSNNNSNSSSSQKKQRKISAFISTTEEIFHADLTRATVTKQIDTLGCQQNCCCLMGDGAKSAVDGLFAVGRKNAVYFYQFDGRGPCLAFDGEKLFLQRFKNYLVVISREGQKQSKPKNDVHTVFVNQPRRQSSLNEQQDAQQVRTEMVNLNIYDIKNKYAAYSATVPPIVEIFNQWGVLYLLTHDGQLLAFIEKDTQNKLETLFQKNQFGLAIDIAKSHLYNEDALVDIFKQYGDHLFKKGDYDGAVDQYIKTIGRSETSHVIKMFLNAQCYHHLTQYLEALHQKSYANEMHTTILLK
ncbi:Vacuolar protein sorting-associated protein 11-like protein, partial [Fragariocoptes setiger]